MSSLNTLKDLFIEELRDLHDAENQLLKALPAMEKAASDSTLKNAFAAHYHQTNVHVQRLEEIFALLAEKSTGRRCKAMKGLIEEGEEHMKENADPAVKDASLIAAAQRVEHYEIAGYGTVRTYARLLGYEQAAYLLEMTLHEETETDSQLTEIANVLNVDALNGADVR